MNNYKILSLNILFLKINDYIIISFTFHNVNYLKKFILNMNKKNIIYKNFLLI